VLRNEVIDLGDKIVVNRDRQSLHVFSRSIDPIIANPSMTNAG
jgi:hypothetical protein